MKQRIWNRWLKIAEIFGTIQMMIILSVVYWLLLPLVAIPFRLVSDPLSLRDPSLSRWVKRRAPSNIFESMKKQY